MKRFFVFIFCFFVPFFSAGAQDIFKIENGKGEFELPFELINDLVVIPVEINGVELSFLLDTGVNATILFSIGAWDSLSLKNSEIIYLRGFGAREPVKALKTFGNEVKIGDAINSNLVFYMVYDNPVDLSNRMGIPINGIIGYDFFKDFVIDFNYTKSFLKAYSHNTFQRKMCKKCTALDLNFFRNKPYVKVSGTIDKMSVPLSLLVDSGSGDALWIFEDAKKGIRLPEKFFPDFPGFGMGGSVYGQRTRIQNLVLGDCTLEGVTASFPDSTYLKDIVFQESRNGSLGAKVLKRFHVTLDYSSKKMVLKPNKNYSEAFEYDMSGIVIAPEGFTIIQDLIRNPLPLRENDPNQTAAGNLIYKSTYNIKYSLEPQYKIVEIRPNAPADQAGLKLGDILIKINGRPAYNYSLFKISHKEFI